MADSQTELDKAFGKPVPAISVLKKDGDWLISFRGMTKKLHSAYLCPFDRAPLFAVWETDDPPLSPAQLNADIGITTSLRMGRKDVSASLIKHFTTAKLQGCIFYDYVPNQPERMVRAFADREQQIIAAAAQRQKAETKGMSRWEKRSAPDVMQAVKDAMAAGRHLHVLSEYEEERYDYKTYKRIAAQYTEAQYKERFKHLTQHQGQQNDRFILIRALDPVTVVQEAFLRTVFGLLQVSDTMVLEWSAGSGATVDFDGAFYELPSTPERRVDWASAFGRLYFRSIGPEALKRLSGLGILVQTNDITGRRPPMYLFNLSAARRHAIAEERLKDLVRPGMPAHLSATYLSGHGRLQSIFNVLLALEHTVRTYAALGDLVLHPALESYIRERVEPAFEVVEERVKSTIEEEREKVTRDAGETMRQHVRLLGFAGYNDFLGDPDYAKVVQLVSAGTLTKEAFKGLSPDARRKSQEWVYSGLLEPLEAGLVVDFPFEGRFGANAHAAANALLAGPEGAAALTMPGPPSLILDLDLLRDTSALKAAFAPSAAIPSAAAPETTEPEAGPKGAEAVTAAPETPDAGGLLVTGPTWQYASELGRIRGAYFHPTGQKAWYLPYPDLKSVPSLDFQNLVRRGVLRAYAMTTAELKARLGFLPAGF